MLSRMVFAFQSPEKHPAVCPEPDSQEQSDGGADVEVPSHSFRTPLPSGEVLELAQSDHASGEAVAPSKPPVLQASPAGSLLSG